jgi:hypothetical protein
VLVILVRVSCKITCRSCLSEFRIGCCRVLLTAVSDLLSEHGVQTAQLMLVESIMICTFCMMMCAQPARAEMAQSCNGMVALCQHLLSIGAAYASFCCFALDHVGHLATEVSVVRPVNSSVLSSYHHLIVSLQRYLRRSRPCSGSMSMDSVIEGTAPDRLALEVWALIFRHAARRTYASIGTLLVSCFWDVKILVNIMCVCRAWQVR